MSETQPAFDCWYLTGPTAAGKTGVAVELAELIGAEIVSLDSMAVYRGMDIGTAKPSAEQRRRVAHHLLDIVEPNEDFSLAQYVAAAHDTIAQIKSRGREILFAGGTPLYLKAMLRGIFEGPEADWEFRRELEAEAAAAGPEALHRRLAEVDPAAAQRLDPQDTRRLIRALEVLQKTGRPISGYQKQFDKSCGAEECRVFVLDWPRDVLHRRINQRTEEMFAAGLVDEVRGLLDRYGRLGRTAAQAVGYSETADHIAGGCDLAAAIERTAARSRQLARRQLTWFRSLSECRWVPVAEPFDANRLARLIGNDQ